MKLTVYYDGKYWVGVVEELDEGKLKAGRYLFGTEPHDAEVLEFIEHQLLPLMERCAQGVNTVAHEVRKINPKRLARQAAQELKAKGVSSRAQQALRLEYEARKLEKQSFSRQQREEMELRKYELRRLKAKAKHRGKA